MTIPEIKLIPKGESEEGRQALGYKWNNIAGSRHKLGGKPDGLPDRNTHCAIHVSQP